MRKLLVLLVSMLMLLGMINGVYAEELMTLYAANEKTDRLIAYIPNNTIRVQQNGVYIDFTDNEGNVVEPQLINDRTMVPFRKIFNALGVTDDNITWEPSTQTVIAKNEMATIELQIDQPVAKKIVGEEVTEIKLDAAPVIVEGRTLVPVRFIAESMNKKVGWDASHQTVIIIDIDAIVTDLESSIPRYIELMNTKAEMPEDYWTKMTMTGKVEYEDKNDKSNNATVNLKGNIDVNKNANALALTALLKLTGKGELYDKIKENNMSKIDVDMITSGKNMYIKSSLLAEKTEGKWLVLEDDSVEETLQLLKQEEEVSLEKIFDIPESSLTIYTYDSLQMATSIIKELLKDDNIQITKKGSTQTYTISFQLEEILSFLSQLGMNINGEGIKGNLQISTSIKNDVVQSGGCELKFSYSEGAESIAVQLKIDGKVSKSTTKITEPKASAVMPFEQK